jgi:hypothetical protein
MRELQAIDKRLRWRVKQRLAVLQHASLYGQRAAADYFGLCAKTVGRWQRRYREEGVAGLVPRYAKRRRSRLTPEVLELIRHAWTVERSGCSRTRIWLQRKYQIDNLDEVQHVRVPAIEVGLRLLGRFERGPRSAFFLRVPDAGFNLALLSGSPTTKRERDDAVVREHVAVERIEGGA